MRNIFCHRFMIVGSILAASIGCREPEAVLKSLDQYVAPAPMPVISVKITDYAPSTGNVLSNLFVKNMSAKNAQGKLSLSSSRDGLSDDFKNSHIQDYGFGIAGPRSGTSGFNDLFLYLAGIVLDQQNLLYCADSLKTTSSSNDAISYSDNRTSPPTQQFVGLHDCEKNYLGLDAKQFDFDQDGVPDYLELLCGLNPKNKNDVSLSISNDKTTNLEKCKRSIPIDESATSDSNVKYGYQYSNELVSTGLQNLSVKNIPVINDGQDNFLLFYIVELNPKDQSSSIFTAYSILKAGVSGTTLQFSYWATDSTKYYNQEIVQQ